MTRRHLLVMVIGTAFGFSISMIGFGEFGELNAMFTFQRFRILLAFVAGVGVAAALFFVFDRQRPTRQRIHKGVVPGAVLFGAGWALTGGCPAVPLVQLGAGYLPAAVSMAGIAAGMYLYRWANTRWFHIDAGNCSL